MSQTFPKYDRFKELQVIFKDLQPVPHQPKVTTIVIRDSVIKNVNGRDVSRGDSVEIRLGGGEGRKKYTGKVPSANFPSRIVPLRKMSPRKKQLEKSSLRHKPLQKVHRKKFP